MRNSHHFRGAIFSIVLSVALSNIIFATKSNAGEINILGGRISWSDKMYISDGCSRYDFSYSNYSGTRLLQLGFELNDPYGRNLIFNSQVGINSNISGTWSMQICKKQFTNGLGPYQIKGIVKEYGSSQRQEIREIYFLPLPGTPTVKAGAKCTTLKSTITSAGKKFTCIKSGNRLVWSAGVKVPAAKPSPVPSKASSGTSDTGSKQGSVSQYKLGDIGPGGGVIFFYKAAGFRCGPNLSATCKYLEAAPERHKVELLDYEHFQSCQYRYRFGQNILEPIETGTEIGTGLKNTLLISSQKSNYFYPERSPALIAQNYRGPNNLSDWYIPSKDELQALYFQRDLVKTLLWIRGSYWSSSDAGGGYIAWGHDFSNNTQFGDQKINPYCIHLVRAF